MNWRFWEKKDIASTETEVTDSPTDGEVITRESGFNFPMLFNSNTKAGVMVTEKSSINFSTVFACVDLIASTISIIPLQVMERTADGKIPADQHDQYYLLRTSPSVMYSRLQWTKMMIVYYLLWGDGISIIRRNKKNRPVEYELVEPWDVEEVEKIRDKATGLFELWYKIRGEVYHMNDIIHFSDLSIDGKKGAGRISSQSESIGLGVALRDYGNDLFKNGAKLRGYVFGEKKMTDDAYRTLANNFITGYGSDTGVGILPHGWRYEGFKYPLPAADAQYLEAKKFSAEEICSIFRTNPFLIGLSSGINNSVAENLIRSWLMTTIAPITTMMELELDRKSFRLTERGKLYTKYNLFALDKADIVKTMEALVSGVNNGLINKDEARDVLDRNPIPGGLGADFYQALNMAPLDVAKDYFLSSGGE